RRTTQRHGRPHQRWRQAKGQALGHARRQPLQLGLRLLPAPEQDELAGARRRQLATTWRSSSPRVRTNSGSEAQLRAMIV
ncbi:hypothetical protein, partial [Klebsiella pneumoniae]|uniref:hypothetical protein n=1 Tax=Klebsiella pneumoniae TaxID=573 RepID=UPI0038542E49